MPALIRPRTALVVIDLQRGFFATPVLAAQAARVVDATNELLRRGAARGVPIFIVRTVHAVDRSTWTLSMLADDQGFNFPGTPEVELLDGLVVPPGSHDVVKIRDSAFHGTDLAQRIRLLGVTRLLVCGVEAENCVALTGRDAFAHDLEVAFAVEAIASGHLERGNRALADNRTEVRQGLLTHAEVDGWW